MLQADVSPVIERTYAPMPARDALIERMLSFRGNFDGYPSITCSDETLIDNALREYSKVYGSDDPNAMHGPALISYWASESVQSQEQYHNAKHFLRAWVECARQCNMTEGENPVHLEVGSE